MALTCRILHSHGHESGLAGQVTARANVEGTYWTQTLGIGFDEMFPENMLLVNEDLDVLDGHGIPNPANRFHSWIYHVRSDVQCIIHTHPLHVTALSLLERPLRIAHMDSCMPFDNVAFLPRWPGVPVGNEEGQLIAETLGSKRAALLAHHGLVVAATSIEEACVMAVQFEWPFSLKRRQNCNLWQRLSDRSVTSNRHSGTRCMIGFSSQAAVAQVLATSLVRHYGRLNRTGFAGGSNFPIGWSHDKPDDEQVLS